MIESNHFVNGDDILIGDKRRLYFLFKNMMEYISFADLLLFFSLINY